MNSACFTGHRNLPYERAALELKLCQILENYINKHGLTDFYAGGAVGWDTLAAQTVITAIPLEIKTSSLIKILHSCVVVLAGR